MKQDNCLTLLQISALSLLKRICRYTYRMTISFISILTFTRTIDRFCITNVADTVKTPFIITTTGKRWTNCFIHTFIYVGFTICTVPADCTYALSSFSIT